MPGSQTGPFSCSASRSVLDLPHLHQKPSYNTLHDTLSSLTLAPASWDLVLQDENSSAAVDGLPAYFTRVIASPLSWLGAPEREVIWELASRRLSERSGRSGMGDFERVFQIPLARPEDPFVDGDRGKGIIITKEVLSNDNGKAVNKEHSQGEKLEIRIHEPALMGDQLGHKTWLGAYVLARQLPGLLPKYFPQILNNEIASNEKSVTILELGAGTGLTGVTAAALFPRRTEVLLTDLPGIIPNLRRNVGLNAHLFNTTDLNVRALDWSCLPERKPLEQKFDLILAADSLYAPEHPGWLTNAMVMYLSRKNGIVFTVLPFREMERDYHEELRVHMAKKRFLKVEEGNIVGVEDWHSWRGREEVWCWWCVWRWEGKEEKESNEVETVEAVEPIE